MCFKRLFCNNDKNFCPSKFLIIITKRLKYLKIKFYPMKAPPKQKNDINEVFTSTRNSTAADSIIP